MKKLLDWIDRKRTQHGRIVVLMAALALFTVLALHFGIGLRFFYRAGLHQPLSRPSTDCPVISHYYLYKQTPLSLAGIWPEDERAAEAF